MEESKRLLGLLEERLEQHDKNREEVQSLAKRICFKAQNEADVLEERISGKIHRYYEEMEERILGFIKILADISGSGEEVERETIGKCLKPFVMWAEQELPIRQRYKLFRLIRVQNFDQKYKLNVSAEPLRKRRRIWNGEEEGDFTKKIEELTAQLQEQLVVNKESARAAQDKLLRVCDGRREKARAFVEKINRKLEPLFTEEDARLQSFVKQLRENVGCRSPNCKSDELISQARLALLLTQRYALRNTQDGCSLDLIVTKEPFSGCHRLRGEKASNRSSIPHRQEGDLPFLCILQG